MITYVFQKYLENFGLDLLRGNRGNRGIRGNFPFPPKRNIHLS